MVQPICDVETLWKFDEKTANVEAARRLTNYRDKIAEGKPEILVCHDMKGGYLEEESDEGIMVRDGCPNPYVFLNWWNIDVFCYFSHCFVTIPPTSYTNLGHEHGCLVLGTFITEGKELCARVLASEETVLLTVDRLVSIARAYNFDGWLINIENRVLVEHRENLKLFLRLLTDYMREAVEHSRVIWYDSVIASGRLHWQNQLNELNKIWYENCDGIYLNYGWGDEELLNSADHGKIHRIYVGIDVFARGCIGGWDCYRSFAKANLMRMSIALFAPGWVCEKFPDADPIEHGLKFWKKLTLYAPPRPILELPINTNFCAGFTNETDGCRFRLSSISLQPHFTRLEQPTPLGTGGVLLKKGTSTRIFCFDVHCSGCRITIHANRQLEVVVNDCVVNATRDQNKFIAIINRVFQLRSLDIRIDDEADCQLSDITVEEISKENEIKMT
ncbi:unnamed protein product [Cylicocyclus nassatus]|uniref:Cytosolic endo-beta-N-acetylglucosaminidase TIM barrel domain-containing protein n=1 Tax=Cylicocyclus nassatus TaxID=53992 RepID=A0AA36GT67_CYLNA|nr:unnamed protein product [Cylicocyclus nassatus]